MFKINNNTLFMEFNGENTIVYEENNELKFVGNLLNSILNFSCIYYGSSLKGRIMGSKNILGGCYKLPIMISEKNNIIFFPIKEEKSYYWLNFNKVQNYEKSQNGIVVLFKNGEKKCFSITPAKFNNQLLKCSRLWLVYLTRG